MKKLLIIFFILSAFDLSAQCVEDSHHAFENSGWFSCQKTISDNPERGISHWVMYDLASIYGLVNMEIWNHNVWGETEMGVKKIILDYSIDKENWASTGIIEISKATGSWKYVTGDPIELGGLTARYVLITVLETWSQNEDCAGIAELRFGVEETTTSTTETTLANTIELSPNPASDILSVSFSDYMNNATIQIVNGIGQIVQSMPIEGEKFLDVEIAHLEGGVYHMQVISKESTATKSFIKID